jgi:hypothetical protein
MDDILLHLLRGTAPLAAAEEIQAATAMVVRLAGRDHRQRWKTHPLGFFHLAEDVGPGTRLRIHVWPRGWAVSGEQVGGEIHNHIFDLRSLVLVGSITNQVFEVAEDQNGEFQLLNIEYSSGTSRVAPSGPAVRLEELSSYVHTTGEVHNVPAGVFHRSSAEATPAITLVLAASASVGKHPLVALAAGHRPPSAFQRRSLNSIELDLLAEALSCGLAAPE